MYGVHIVRQGDTSISRKTYWFIMGQGNAYDASAAGDVSAWVAFDQLVRTHLSVIRHVHGGSQRTEDTELFVGTIAPELAEFREILQLGDGLYSRQEDRPPRHPPPTAPRRPLAAARRGAGRALGVERARGARHTRSVGRAGRSVRAAWSAHAGRGTRAA